MQKTAIRTPRVHRPSNASLAMLLLLSAPAWAQTPPPADTLYRNGTIITLDEQQPEVQALAVKDGRIVFAGSQAGAQAYLGPATRVVDLAGKTMMPGFIDAHGHVFNAGIQALAANLLAPPDGKVGNIAALQQSLRDWAAQPGNRQHGIILGFGYDDSQLAEQRHPTRQELDAVSKDVPVLIIHQSGHLAALNSKALQLAGISRDSQDPAGGKIRREADGKTPDGVLEETAFFATVMPLFNKLGPKENAAILQAGIDLYTRYGYTTAQEGRATSNSVKFMYGDAQAGKFKIDIVAYPDIQSAQDVLRPPYLSRNYMNGFRVGGAKLNLDGSPQGKTAWLTQPYFVPPPGQKPGYKGYPSMPDADAQRYVALAMKNNWQLLTHVNGDAAIDQLIGAVAAGQRQYGQQDRRFVAIHAQTAREDQVAAFQRLAILPSFFPMHTFYWGDWHRDSVLGAARAENISPTGWALQRGMRFTSHHDAPVALPDSMRVYSATVNRTTRSGKVLGADQRVSPLVGLKAQTLWSAYQHFEENDKGSLVPGKVADLVVLSANPLTVAPQQIADIKVEETIKGDQTVYRRAAASPSAACVDNVRCSERILPAFALAGLAPHPPHD
ncbi:amidohydrolase [Crenobacter caeni]|uniref:Amidohydrolase n=1 Tax=Crenobacter caeni TaxID=2705474 RepID=A0A6B2KUB3_9NEIS|nr:amidohydrolase [Crenobacter caeni]NDV13694.1 amidohydrolase [Crenobacter caeni]